MGEKLLVESKISDSELLVQTLDLQGFSPSFVAWYFYEDAEDWRLLIAGPTFDDLLPKREVEAYRILAEAIRKIDVIGLTLADVKVLKTDSKLLDAMAFVLRTESKSIIRAHFTDNYINGVFLKEMYILRSAGSPATVR